MPRINPKHALTKQEREFCKIHLALGAHAGDAAETYRRAFLRKRGSDGKWYEPGEGQLSKEDIDGYATITPKEVSRRANTLLKREHIRAYLDELKRPVGDHARSVLADQAMFGNDPTARRAAEQILAQEDKHGFRGAVERFIDILCEIGAEIEVPLPTRFQKTIRHTCECGEQIVIELDEPLFVRAPLVEMFPRDKPE